MRKTLALVLLGSSLYGGPPAPLSQGTAHAAGVLQPLPPKIPTEPLRLAGPPVSLTSSDGAGLRIVSFKARAVVEDPLAFTELDLVFQNPQQRQIEGQFEITLPEGATISRFAMRQGDHWQEGEVVELQAAREAYEDFLHRRQDPALLEKAAGNSFRARVFPIPAAGTKELMVSFSQERKNAADPYRIFLRGLPALDALDIRAIVGKSQAGGAASSLGGTTLQHQIVEVHKDHFTPDVDFEVAVPQAPNSVAGLRHDNLVVARVTPVTADRPEPIDGGLTILFDTSASRALGFAEQVERLGALIDTLQKSNGKLHLRVVCFDQDQEEVYQGTAAGFGKQQLDRIKARHALGASNLGQALADSAKGGPARVVLFTDGVATAGQTEGNDLRKVVAALKQGGVRRLDAVTFGGIRDEAVLRRLVTAGLAADGVVVDGDLPVQAVARKLGSATVSGIQVAVPGSGWVWPTQLDGVQPGDQVLVYADLPASQPFSVQLGGQTVAQGTSLARVERPLLERAWVGARIKRLLHQRDTLAENDQDLREALRHQIIDLSTKFRVLSDFTALLVLETEWDYQRFHIDRRALSDILTVGAGGIELLNRTQPMLAAQTVEAPEQPVQTAQPVQQQPATKRPAPPPRPLMKAKEESAKRDEAPKPAKAAAADKDSSGGRRLRDMSRGPAQGDSMGGLADLDDGGRSNRESQRQEREQKMISGAPAGGAASSPMRGHAAPGPRASSAPPRNDPGDPLGNQGWAPPATPAAEPAQARPMAPPPPPPPPPGAPMMDGRRRTEQAPAPDAAMMRRPSPLAVARPPAATASSPRNGNVLQLAREQPKLPDRLPYEGKLLAVMTQLQAKKTSDALRAAWAWRDEDPGDVLALIGLGEALEAQGQVRTAARAYGSIIDLFPGRADLRRFAGERLERLGQEGLGLAVDTYKQARAQRADHPASHRLLAYALLRAGQPAAAFDVMAEGARRSYPPGRFNGVTRILGEDLGLIAAAWIHKEPKRRAEILSRLSAAGGALPEHPSLRFVLNWETDANDVDFHIYDAQGGHAFYSQRQLPSGGELYADVTTGYGPECFTIEGPPPAFPYHLQAHYYSRGPMGYGMGKLEIIEHDGKGGLRFAERPFVIMVDQAFVDLGQVTGSLR